MMETVFSTAFLPPISYFVFFQKADSVIIDLGEHYQKQTIRNRCNIITSQKPMVLTVPIKAASKRESVSQVMIDNSVDWQKKMLRSLQTAYGKAPFFEFYFDYYHKAISQKHDKLVDLNLMLMTICLKSLKISKPVKYVYEYNKEYEGCFDLRNGQFDNKIQQKTYSQVFGSVFVPDTSIIDLLFCEGPNATNVLNSSIIT